MGTMVDLRAEARRVRVPVPDLGALNVAARATWRGRMINEHGSAVVFEGLARQLADIGAPADAVEACRGFADEERRHGVLCGAVLEALGGEARWEAPAPESFPMHPDVPPREAALRNVLSVCCLAETVAVALISAERAEMPDSPVRRLLTDILADEVGHARFGWRWLAHEAPGLSAAARERLGAWLGVAFAHLERHELANLVPGARPAPTAGAALGLCDAGAQRALFYETVEAVIVPRLEAHGLPAARAWADRLTARA